MSWGIQFAWSLDDCARLRNVTVTVAIKFNWGVIFTVISRAWFVYGFGACMSARGGARLHLQLQ